MDIPVTQNSVTPASDTTEGTPCCDEQTAPTTPPALQQVDALAERLKALADPTRLRMVDLLAQQRAPLCVCEINEHFAQRQPTISHHLRILREAGLIDCEKRGVWAYYWATDAGSQWLSAVRGLR
jgi:ArsR family transcriptional regulator, arsenate/arsenite/antimonite-responsive transcriptional repressor